MLVIVVDNGHLYFILKYAYKKQDFILFVAGAPSDAEVVDPLAVAVDEGGEGEGDAPLHGLHALGDVGHLGGGVAHPHQGWTTQGTYRII